MGTQMIHSLSTAKPWWRHQNETFSALLAICAGSSPVTGEFPAQRPVSRNFDVFFEQRRLNKPLSKQWWGWWFETLSRPLCRHCNAHGKYTMRTTSTSKLMLCSNTIFRAQLKHTVAVYNEHDQPSTTCCWRFNFVSYSHYDIQGIAVTLHERHGALADISTVCSTICSC